MLGIASGVNAITARFLGAMNPKKVEKAVHTSFILCLTLGILLLLFGLLFTKPVLLLLHTKKELIDGAVLYLTIYLCGSPALAMFNYGNAILSASGDTYIEDKGIASLQKYATLFGLGQKTGIEIPESEPKISDEYRERIQHNENGKLI